MFKVERFGHLFGVEALLVNAASRCLLFPDFKVTKTTSTTPWAGQAAKSIERLATGSRCYGAYASSLYSPFSLRFISAIPDLDVRIVDSF